MQYRRVQNIAFFLSLVFPPFLPLVYSFPLPPFIFCQNTYAQKTIKTLTDSSSFLLFTSIPLRLFFLLTVLTKTSMHKETCRGNGLLDFAP